MPHGLTTGKIQAAVVIEGTSTEQKLPQVCQPECSLSDTWTHLYPGSMGPSVPGSFVFHQGMPRLETSTDLQ